MKDEGSDISQYERRQITEDDLDKYEVIVSMASESDTPRWLLESPKYTHWEIEDPRGQDYKTTAKVRDLIKEKVKDLLKTNSSEQRS